MLIEESPRNPDACLQRRLAKQALPHFNTLVANDIIIQMASNEQATSARAGRKWDPANFNSGLKGRVYEELQSLAGEGGPSCDH